MKIMFSSNARERLLEYLGFSAEEVERMGREGGFVGGDTSTTSSLPPAPGGGSGVTRSNMSAEAEDLVKRSLLVGNFDLAVDVCFSQGALADALILSSCGGGELWARTQARYFEKEKGERPFLNIVNAIIHSELGGLVEGR